MDPLDPLTFFALFGADADVTCPYCQVDLLVTSEKVSGG